VRALVVQYRAQVRTRLGCFFALCMLVVSCTASTEMASEATSDGETFATEAPTQELPSDELYTSIENSIVYVLSPDDQSSGSGIVIDGGWILTNAHVVDRHETVRIGRSDGEDLGLHPVHSVDWIFDLALVGPLDDASLEPMLRGDSADLSLGSRVLLVGFPDEGTVAPTPTLTEGIVSRRRAFALGDYSFLQVDATIAPGQSGGALVNGRGELVGMSGLEFGQGEFGMAFASAEMFPRIDNMVAEPGVRLPSGPGEAELVDSVGQLRNYSFIIEVDQSGLLELEAASEADIWVDVQSLGGITLGQLTESVDPFRALGVDNRFFFNETDVAGESVSIDVDPGSYQVLIGTLSVSPVEVSITSPNPLHAFADVEEGAELDPNVLTEGNFDWVRDTDTWQLELTAGQQVSIVADGIADTVLVVRLDDEVIGTSDDEGLGVFGTGSQIEFVTEVAGSYQVEVGTYDTTRWGYLIEATVTS